MIGTDGYGYQSLSVSQPPQAGVCTAVFRNWTMTVRRVYTKLVVVRIGRSGITRSGCHDRQSRLSQGVGRCCEYLGLKARVGTYVALIVWSDLRLRLRGFGKAWSRPRDRILEGLTLVPDSSS